MTIKTTPKCTAVTRHGHPCGRATNDTSTGVPLCHVHRAKAAGTPLSIVSTPSDIDEMRIIRDLARSRNDSIKLRAAELLLELKREALKVKAPAKKNNWIDRCTPDQVDQLLAIKAAALTQKLRPRGPEDTDPALYQPIPDAKHYDTTPPESAFLAPEDRAVEPVVEPEEPEDDSYLDEVPYPELSPQTWRERGDYWLYHEEVSDEENEEE